MIEFQYYPANIKSNKPAGTVTLEQFIRVTKNPKPSVIEIFNQIAQAETNGDMKLKAELKQNNLFYFTPCAFVNGFRRYINIVHFTGLMVLDFDHFNSREKAVKLKHELFERPYIIAAWLSPSKRGVKALVNIPVVHSVEKFKEYYFGISVQMSKYKEYDDSGQNCVLPLFQSYDPELLQRDDYTIWDIKGEKQNDYDKVEIKPRIITDTTDKHKETVCKIINSGFRNIYDNGHPQLRSLCLAIGGYIASGYIDQNEALQLIYYNIENHPYLRKGISGYKRTALQMISTGQLKQLIL